MKQATFIKPVELCFRHCTIIRDTKTGKKRVHINELPDFPPHELKFNARYYKVGDTFYAILMENKYFSGRADDGRCTLVNMNKTRPKLFGSNNIGSSIVNCSSGTGKPPSKSYSKLKNKKAHLAKHKNKYEIFNEFLLIQDSLSTEFKSKLKINLTINDMGIPEVLFSKNKINHWKRMVTLDTQKKSRFGIQYKVAVEEDPTIQWNLTCQ